jgi:predicted Zn-dependent protease
MKSLIPTVLILMIAACATSPLGRKRILLMSDSTMDSMGTQSFEELKKKTPIEKDPAINAYVKCVAGRIADATKGEFSNQTWEIVVFKDQTANAFALPGGKIGVHTGILPVAKSPGQLAAVLGHEVGHVTARHGNERVSEGEAAAILMGLTDVVLGKMDPQKKQTIMAGIGIGLQFGALLPFSRSHESEADLIGLDLMAKAGFDPMESVELWKNMKAANGSGPPEWLSTHPSNDRRIGALQSNAPAHQADYQNAISEGRAPHCQRPAGLL